MLYWELIPLQHSEGTGLSACNRIKQNPLWYQFSRSDQNNGEQARILGDILQPAVLTRDIVLVLQSVPQNICSPAHIPSAVPGCSKNEPSMTHTLIDSSTVLSLRILSLSTVHALSPVLALHVDPPAAMPPSSCTTQRLATRCPRISVSIAPVWLHCQWRLSFAPINTRVVLDPYQECGDLNSSCTKP